MHHSNCGTTHSYPLDITAHCLWGLQQIVEAQTLTVLFFEASKNIYCSNAKCCKWTKACSDCCVNREQTCYHMRKDRSTLWKYAGNTVPLSAASMGFSTNIKRKLQCEPNKHQRLLFQHRSPMLLISCQHYHQMLFKENEAISLRVLRRIQPRQASDSFATVAVVHLKPQQTWDTFKRVGLRHTRQLPVMRMTLVWVGPAQTLGWQTP